MTEASLFSMIAMICVASVASLIELYALRRLIMQLNKEINLRDQTMMMRLRVLEDKLNDLRVKSRWDGSGI